MTDAIAAHPNVNDQEKMRLDALLLGNLPIRGVLDAFKRAEETSFNLGAAADRSLEYLDYVVARAREVFTTDEYDLIARHEQLLRQRITERSKEPMRD